MGCCESNGNREGALPPPPNGDIIDQEGWDAPIRPCADMLKEELLEGQVNEQPDTDWVRLGGTELEEALTNEWVKLVRADWLIRHAEAGGVLARRQDMPLEAYVGLDELKRAGCGVLTGRANPGEWLRVVAVSYPWLQPGHPDPHGESLRRIAKVLRRFVDDSQSYFNGGKPYGVFIDFTALHQVPRSEQEHEVFLRALPALQVFFAHHHTIVLKVTSLPEGYPHSSRFQYDLPEGANTATYHDRGWCFAESALSGLVKSTNKVLDVGRYPGQGDLFYVMSRCKAKRDPPLHTGNFKELLNDKTFTSKRTDFDEVVKLYSAAFERRLGSAAEVDYHDLGWGADAAEQLAAALQSGCLLQMLNLNDNSIGNQGATVLAEALQRTPLQTLYLRSNGIGQQGAVALGQALQRRCLLHTLRLSENMIGSEGAAALGEALRSNASLQTLELGFNCIGQEGAIALGQALHTNETLKSLDLAGNKVGVQGVAAVGVALQSNRSLRELDLASSGVGDQGAVALAGSLQSNHALWELNLESNQIREQGAVAFGAALQRNRALQTLNLRLNWISPDGAIALGQALQSNRTLRLLYLGNNFLGSQGRDALRQAVRNRPTALKLIL